MRRLTVNAYEKTNVPREDANKRGVGLASFCLFSGSLYDVFSVAQAARESRPHCGRMGCECQRFWNLHTGRIRRLMNSFVESLVKFRPFTCNTGGFRVFFASAKNESPSDAFIKFNRRIFGNTFRERLQFRFDYGRVFGGAVRLSKTSGLSRAPYGAIPTQTLFRISRKR